MLAVKNTYLPITLAPSEVRLIEIEDIISVVPQFDVKIVIRNIEGTLTIPVVFSQTLNVEDAPMAFAGSWPNVLVTTSIAPEGVLFLTPPTTVDGVYTTHTVQLTNPSGSANALLHLLIVGEYEAINAQNIQTIAVLP